MLIGFSYHVNGTVRTDDIYDFGCPDRLTATGADIFPGTAGFLRLRLFPAHAAGANDCQLVSPVLGRTEGLERRGRLGYRPSNFGVIVNAQAALFGLLLEALIVVGIPPAGILNTVQMAPVMHHFMKQGRYGTCYGPVKSFRTQVDFMGRGFTLTVCPHFADREVPVS